MWIYDKVRHPRKADRGHPPQQDTAACPPPCRAHDTWPCRPCIEVRPSVPSGALTGLAVPDPFDSSPGPFVFLIADKGAEADEIKDKSKEDILNQAHNAGSKYIPTADMDILCVNSLKKCGDRQDGAVNCE